MPEVTTFEFMTTGPLASVIATMTFADHSGKTALQHAQEQAAAMRGEIVVREAPHDVQG